MFNENVYKQALKEIYNEQYAREISALKNIEVPEPSNEFKRKMKEIIKKSKSRIYKYICTTGRRAACIFITSLIILTSLLSVKAIREAIYDFIVKHFYDHDEIVNVDKERASISSEITWTNYNISVPEGFDLIERNKTYVSEEKIYIKNEKYIVFIQTKKEEFKLSVDAEKASKEEKGEYLIYNKENNYTYIWSNSAYIFTIESNLSQKQIEDICKSVVEM